MKKIVLIAAVSLIIFGSCSQQKAMRNGLVVAFYNVENLFDTISNPNKLDTEFIPQGERQWNSERYWKKINDLGKVISSIDSGNLPVLLGLCELENDLVLKDLAADKQLKSANYQMVWNESPDIRGIDCALLYNPSFFSVSKTQFLQVNHPTDSTYLTREIVYAEGVMGNETFHVFVNHWPSRRGGQDESSALRSLAAYVLKAKVDSIMGTTSTPNIIIMGDMNDTPTDTSLLYVLQAAPNNSTPQNNQLVNLMYDEHERGEGSYSFRGTWNMLDNLIVSGYLLNKSKGLSTTLDNGYIFRQPFMEYTNNDGQKSPNRTYGRTYFGGISDHFPVYFVLKK